MDEVQVVGLYPVTDHPGVHLVELIVEAPPEEFDIGDFTQEDPSLPDDEWPVPHDERYLNEGGDQVVGDLFEEPPSTPTTRLAFFLHGLDPARPLITPFGQVPLPAPQPMPARLAGLIEYEPPEEE